MAYSARILADSLAPCGERLVTMEVTFPRFVLAEFNTHRIFSRNGASSRAIPVEKLIQRVLDDPVYPVWWGKNQPGMRANEELEGNALKLAREAWRFGRDEAVRQAKRLHELGTHKQIVNRLLEPWLWMTMIVSSTSYANFFNLRCHPDAQPEIRVIAEMMRDLYLSTKPVAVPLGAWHLPLTGFEGDEHLTLEELCKVSVARCARVSYLTHEGKRDVEKDFELHDRLLASGHCSPFEHVAEALGTKKGHGNFCGWRQYRKGLKGEHRDVYPWPEDAA